ncbi:MAG: glycosyltransferase family 2 protein [Vicinamibacterales bacterium]
MAAAEDTTVVIPTFNEAAAIGGVVTALRGAARWREILVVDDGSNDGTAEAARAAGATVIRHPYNKGNGAAVKSGLRRAQGEYILILDGDGQHRPEDAARLVARLGEYDLVVGARSSATQASGARRVGNAVLNGLASYLCGRTIPDLTSGFRAARTAYIREFMPLLPNGFSTPTTTTLAFIKAGHSVAFEPVDARSRAGHSKIRLGPDGVKFLLILLRVVTLYSPLRVFVPVSLSAFIVGLAYGSWTVATQSKIPNGAVLLLMFAVMVFLVGLVSEQISLMRPQGRD